MVSTPHSYPLDVTVRSDTIETKRERGKQVSPPLPCCD